MRKGEKYWILGLIILTAIILIIVTTKNSKSKKEESNINETQERYTQVLEDGTKLNISNKLNETKTVGNLTIGDIQLTNKNGQSILLANVTNNGSTETKVMLIDIVLYNKAGEKIATIPGIISPLKAGETTQLNTTTQQDYTNAYDFEIIQK